jgi:hypothetical protein
MTQIPSLAQLIKQAIETRLLDVHTALIAKVESYDAKKQLVDVAPMLKRRIKNQEDEWVNEQLPLLCDVPVLFPRAGGFFISFPIKPGDFVQLIFNEVNIEEWLENSRPTIACNERFTLHGAVAIPGVYPQSKALSDAHETNLVLGIEQGLQIHIDSEKIRLGSADAHEALAIASKVIMELELLRTTVTSFTGTTFPPMSDIATRKVVAE